MSHLTQDPDFLRIFYSGDKEWPGYKVPDNPNASLPLLISEIYRLIPYIGSQYVHFYPKNMPDVKIDKVEIIGIVTDKTQLAKYTSFTVDDSTGAIPVLYTKNVPIQTEAQELSDEEFTPPFGLPPRAPYSYERHILNLWCRARDEKPMYDEIFLYDYVHVLGFCAMSFRNQKHVSELTDDDIKLGRLFFFGMNLRRISEAEHNEMMKTLITHFARDRYEKPKV